MIIDLFIWVNFIADNSVHICIGTYTNTLLVYRETELKWASQLPFPPVALSRADFTVSNIDFSLYTFSLAVPLLIRLS